MPAQLLTVFILLTGQVSSDSAAERVLPAKPGTMSPSTMSPSTGSAVPGFSSVSDPLRRGATEQVKGGIVTELGQPVVAKPKTPDAVLFTPGTTRAPETRAADPGLREAPRQWQPGSARAVPWDEKDPPGDVAPAAELPENPASDVAAAADDRVPDGGTTSRNRLRSEQPPAILKTSGAEPVRMVSPLEQAAATELLQHVLAAPRDPSLALPGQPRTLQQLLEQLADRGQRLAAIKGYWKLSAEVAKYHWSLEELEFLAELPAGRLVGESKLLVAAQADAQAFAQQLRLAATGAQSDLGELLRAGEVELSVWPADLPLVGLYQTKFDRIFAGRTAPASLRRIATQLPQQLELIDLRAAAVAAATDSLKELAHEYRQGQVALPMVLDVQSRLRRLRLEFVDVVRQYNEQIAEYALAIGGSGDNQTVVGMLIKNTGNQRLTVPAAARLESPGSRMVPSGAAGRPEAGRPVNLEAPATRFPALRAPQEPTDQPAWRGADQRVGEDEVAGEQVADGTEAEMVR